MAKNAIAARESQSSGHAAPAGIAVRTCIGCRKTGDRNQLVRLVRHVNDAGETVALVDVRRRMPGRGAWLHPDGNCWTQAIKRRAVARALQGVGNVSDVELFAQTELPSMAVQDQKS